MHRLITSQCILELKNLQMRELKIELLHLPLLFMNGKTLFSLFLSPSYFHHFYAYHTIGLLYNFSSL